MCKTALAVGVILAVMAGPAMAQSSVEVFASLTDANGGVPATLDPADVRLTEGTTDLKVVKVESLTAWPTKLQVLLDNGAGMGSENLIHLRNGLRNLLGALPDGVEVTVVSTAPQPRMVLRATADRALIAKAPDLVTPDSGAGRFVDSLKEALQRTERDKSNHFAMIVTLGTSAGDANVMERDIKQIQQRIVEKPVTIHAAVITMPGRTASQGAVQGELGMAVTKMTGGRFETIAAVSRVATLLEEFGVMVAESHQKQSRQFRITAERPNASTPPGGVSMAVRGNLRLTGLSYDGRHP